VTRYVRTETPDDAYAVARVIAQAFEGGDEAPVAEVDLVEALRHDRAWLPALSLVAVIDREVVGHVLGSRVLVGGAPAVALAPVSVLPAHQRRGVGAALVERLLAEARGAGETLVVVLGDPRYYSRFGFRAAADVGIIGPYTGETFQALPLAADAPVGDAVYAPPFFAV
jgi:putative acetyltransferase